MHNASNKKKTNSGGLRQRIREGNLQFPPEHTNDRKQTKAPLPSPTSHLITALFLFTFVSVIVILVEKKLPTPLMVDDVSKNPQRFNAERSFNSLVKLTSLGPRVTGSYENEVLALKFFKEELDDIIKNALPAHKVLVDIQKTTGSFTLGFLDGLNSVYVNVQNVVVKLTSQNESPHSLLLNCHYDTVADSPGASDDGASCAVMLEILRIITQMDKPLTHNVIFLFNGAEENILQASHGFITQHKWAKEIRAFVNLEACGAGGREVLFQAGPNHPWLMQKYADSVPYPFASSLAQEIFQSGIIPGDTDFRIFRDFGNISGLDFAWASNGYVYHTKFDAVNQIPLGSLQRTGDNILALTIAIANGHELANVEQFAPGNLVFFDFLGAFVVRWSEIFNAVINVLVMGLSMYTISSNMHAGVRSGVPRRKYAKQLGISTLVVFLSMILTVLTGIGIACVLTAFGRSMSWFSRPIWVVFLYICPSLLVPMAFILYASQKQRPIVKSPWVLCQLYMDANKLFWTILLAISTMFGIRSGFVAFFWILFASVGSILKPIFFKKWTDWKWLALHCTIHFLPFLQCFYLMISAINLVLPIMGRIGAGNFAELIIATVLCSMFSLLLSFITPTILLTRTPSRLFSFLGGLFLSAVALLLVTPLGFPYSGDPTSPAPQRFMLNHAERTYHDLNGNKTNFETGFWIVDMDQNSPHMVSAMVPEVTRAKQVDNCDHQLFCGVPYLLPVLSLIWKTHWIPDVAPNIPIPVTLHADSVETRPNDVRRLTFTITGPDHMGLMISPVTGVEVLGWSILPGPPLKSRATFGKRLIYFVYYSCANDPEPWTFWIDIKGTVPPNQPRFDIAVSSHFMHGPNKASGAFLKFMGQFPPWTAITGWTSTYQSWKF